MKRRGRFAGRITLYFGILAAAIFIIFAVIIFNTIASENTSNILNAQHDMCVKMSEQVDGYYKEIDDISYEIAGNADLLELFSVLSNSNEDNYFDEDYKTAAEVSTLLKTSCIDTVVDRICIYNNRNDFVSGGRLGVRNESLKESLDTVINLNDTFGEMVSRKSNIYITYGHDDWWNSYNDIEHVSMMRPFISRYREVYNAVIEADSDISKLKKIITVGENTPVESLLFTTDGRLITTSDNGSLSEKYADYIFSDSTRLLKSGDTSAFSDQYSAYITAHKIGDYDMILVLVQPETSVFSQYAKILLILIAACLCAFAVILLIINYLSGRLSKPLQDLSESVSKVSMSNLEIEDTENVPSEVQQVYTSFANVLDKLDSAISLEMAAQLDTMQNQINSHFLYNMLAVISALSSEGNDKAVNMMTSKLSEMLHYTNDFSSPFVSFRQETDHTINYLDMMKEYYESDFEYEIDIDGNIESMQVPKMILQPLAENCFSHAFNQAMPPWRIRIEAGIEGEESYFRVINNGTPFKEEDIREIDRRINEYRKEALKSYKKMKFGGLGLVNTIIRMTAVYGDAVSYRIVSENGESFVEVRVR